MSWQRFSQQKKKKRELALSLSEEGSLGPFNFKIRICFVPPCKKVLSALLLE